MNTDATAALRRLPKRGCALAYRMLTAFQKSSSSEDGDSSGGGGSRWGSTSNAAAVEAHKTHTAAVEAASRAAEAQHEAALAEQQRTLEAKLASAREDHGNDQRERERLHAEALAQRF